MSSWGGAQTAKKFATAVSLNYVHSFPQNTSAYSNSLTLALLELPEYPISHCWADNFQYGIVIACIQRAGVLQLLGSH